MWHWSTYCLFLFALLISYVCLKYYDIYKTRERIIYLLMGLLPTFLLMALRGKDVGNDLANYADNVENARCFFIDDVALTLSEPFFSIIYWISYIMGGLRFFIISTSFLEYFFLFIALRTFHKHKLDVRLIFILFFAVVSIRSFSMVRNGVAIACSLCAYANLLDASISSRRRYWFYTILSIGFHNTALINIPVYLICNPISEKVRHYKMHLFFRISVIIVFSVFSFVLAKSDFIDIFYTINEGKYASFEIGEGSGWGNLFIRLPFLVLVIVLFRLLYKEHGRKVLPFLLLVCFDVVVAQFKYINQNFERFSMLTGLGEVILLGMICMALTKRYGAYYKILFLFVGLIYFTYYMYRWAIISEYGIMPYTIWSK